MATGSRTDEPLIPFFNNVQDIRHSCTDSLPLYTSRPVELAAPITVGSEQLRIKAATFSSLATHSSLPHISYGPL